VSATPQPESPALIRWGIIGPGRAAARFAQGLAAVPNSTLVAVWSRNPDRARDYASRFAVPRIAVTIDEFLDSPIEAVYVATHPDTHAAFCIAALHAGKHVLCEKPAALNVTQLESILAAARSASRLFMEAMKPPFFPLYRKLRAHLAAHPIGPIGFVRAGHSDSTLAPDYPLHFRELGGGGILGIGPYEAFLALDWLGPLQRLQTIGRLSPAGVDNFAVFQSEHERGIAQLHTGLDLLSHGDALLSAPGGYARIHANWWNPARATIHYLNGRELLLDEPFTHGGFNYETAHFCDLIRNNQPESPEITHALSLAMANLLQQARTGLGVRFPGE
jgi:scyllo-inositol 2-dehydrogenase (NADP+)